MAVNITKLWQIRTELIRRRAKLLRRRKSCEAIDYQLQTVTTKILKWEIRHEIPRS